MECCTKSLGDCDTSSFFEVGESCTLIQLRSGINTPIAGTSFICARHRKSFVTSYSSRYKKCCGYHLKARPITSNLRIVSLEEYKLFKRYLNLDIIPGKKLCNNCMQNYKQNAAKIRDQPPSNPTDSETTISESQNTASSSEALLTPEDYTVEYFNDFLSKLSLSPLKSLTKLKNRSVIKYAKGKLELFTDALQKKLSMFHIYPITKKFWTNKIRMI